MYLSVTDFAKYFSVGRTTVRDWIVSGKINAIMMGDMYRIPEAEIKRIEITGIQASDNITLSKSLQKSCTRRSKSGGRRPWES